MNKTGKLVFATNNQHKLEEARRIVGDGFEIVSLAEIGCHDDIPETADTLEGNALIKARWVHDRYGCDCFADDTGLMVDALGGAPGVYSARYAGEHCSPADNVAKLLKEMEGVDDRRARFATVMALIADGETHCFEGCVEGKIAHAPHGAGGFGYDPIFVADESGKCFAEMSADDKNAISHRGRALRKLRAFLGVIIVTILSLLSVAPASAESWRLHASFDGDVDRIIDTSAFTYFLGLKQTYKLGDPNASIKYGELFKYDKEGDEILTLNAQNKLSKGRVNCVEYNFDKNYLVVAYDNGNIDLLYDNGDVVNVPGLMAADSSLEKSVNSITFDKDNDLIYLATQFGFVSINDRNGEVQSSRIYNVPVKSVAKLAGRFVVATEENVYYGDEREFSLDNMTLLKELKGVDKFVPFGNSLFTLFTEGTKTSCGRFTVIEPDLVWSDLSTENCVTIERGERGLLVVELERLRWFGNDGKESTATLSASDSGFKAGSSNGRDIWFSAGRPGIYQKRVPADGSGNWSLLKDKIRPNSSSAFMCTSMAYHDEYGMLVRNHGYDANFNGGYLNYYKCPDLISGYKDMNWTPLSVAYRLPGNLAVLSDNPDGIAIDPNNPDHVYCGSTRSGMLRLDLKNPQNSLKMTRKNDWYGGYMQPGFIEVVPDHNSVWTVSTMFARPDFDGSGNLWSAYVNPRRDGSGADYSELWVWTPEDRAASTNASNFRPWKKLRFDDMVSSNTPKIYAMKSPVNKNIVIYHGNNAAKSPLLVLDHKGTFDTQTDDVKHEISAVYDQDGNRVDYGYLISCYEDPVTGQVWIGYRGGIFTFQPKELLSGSNSVRRIKVPRNDGTNLADYLLDGIMVNCIVPDSEGRKWIGTTGAGLVCVSSNGTQILKNYTSDNSMLPGDNVYAVALNPQTNSLMISTDEGLCELFLSSEAGDGEEARAYPNPVRPDYFGYVTIDNLPESATVKIVDAGGNIIKECGMAEGGVARWDVTNMYHKRVPAGVYFVVAGAGPDGESFSKVSKILVIN